MLHVLRLCSTRKVTQPEHIRLTLNNIVFGGAPRNVVAFVVLFLESNSRHAHSQLRLTCSSILVRLRCGLFFISFAPLLACRDAVDLT